MVSINKLFAPSTLKQWRCELISATTNLRKIRECRESNPGWLGGKHKCNLCAMPSTPLANFSFIHFLEWSCSTLPFLITCISAYRSVGFTIHVTSKNEPLYLLTRNDWKQVSFAPTWLSSDLPSEQLPVSCQPWKKRIKQMSVALPFNHSIRIQWPEKALSEGGKNIIHSIDYNIKMSTHINSNILLRTWFVSSFGAVEQNLPTKSIRKS